MKARMLFPTLLAAATALAAAPETEKAPDGDLARLQGKWTTSAGPQKDIPVILTIQGRAVVVDLKTPQWLKIRVKGEIKIDDKARPRTLDWVHFSAIDGQDMPEVLAIYELDGDVLKVCNGGPNNGRPTEFKPGEGALADVLTFHRRKDETKTEGAG
jgi:uncharacterized protein (TIGR03067 family)